MKKRKRITKVRKRGAIPKLVEGLTGPELALQLGVSDARVRQMRAEGKITPLAGSSPGKPRYGKLDLQRLLERYEDPETAPQALAQLAGAASPVDEALAAFALFATGASLETVVTDLRMVPAKVRALYREWSTPLEAENREAGIRERANAKQSDREREIRQEERARLDADYQARMIELDKDAPKLKKRMFDVVDKGREKRREAQKVRMLEIEKRRFKSTTN